MIALPLTATAWTVLFAVGIALAALGTEYRARPIFDAPDHWTNNAAYAVMVTGRAVVFLAVVLSVAGQVA